MSIAQEFTPTRYLATNKGVMFNLVHDMYSTIPWINLGSVWIPLKTEN